MELGNGESVVMHSHSSIVHYLQPSSSSLGSMDLEGSHSHPKAVMRGFAELDKVETGKGLGWCGVGRCDHREEFSYPSPAHLHLHPALPIT